jgi:N-hydroxyarylamine O-acetyltransferase
MHASNFNLEKYLSHIGYSGKVQADLDTLTALMRLQLRKVPFENLDVQAGQVVSLAPQDIVRKILVEQRGGYCYEVNGLFSMALQEIGIPHFYVAARPMFYAQRRPKTHMAIVAKLNNELWLCDLGFGSYGLRQPLNLNSIDFEVKQDQDVYKLSVQLDGEYLLSALVHGQWMPQYAFDLHSQEWLDFEPVNYLNSTHPDTIFVRQLLVILQTSTGRKILSDRLLKIWTNGFLTERMLSAHELSSVLQEEFGLLRT